MSSLYSSLNQRGAALIALVFMLGLAFSAYVLMSYKPLNIQAAKNIQTARALAEAKAAIIGWSVKNNTAPGRLPCPEDTSKIGTDREGEAASSCTLPAIGRLPFKTLGVGDLRDGNKDRLWYVVSEGFRNLPINSETAAQLTVDGVSNSAVAIVFSPGVPLEAQQRDIPTSGSPPEAVDYLDLTNNNGDNIFISRSDLSGFNDRLLSISHQELFSLVEARVLRDAKNCLDNYASSSGEKYPWAVPVADTTTYTGVYDVTFGRVPTNIVTTALVVFGVPIADPQMQASWSADCIFNTSNTTVTYWNNGSGWGNLVFYQLASGYRPRLSMTPTCGASCLAITGSGNSNAGSGSYRAVLIMASSAIGVQNRSIPSVTSNYLEEDNVHSTPSPSLTFETYVKTDSQYAIVNDLVICLDGNNNCQ